MLARVTRAMLGGRRSAMIVDPQPPPQQALTGLDFQGSASTLGTVRFQFLNPLAIYPATYIWRLYPRQQAGYYTTFFWGTGESNFWWDSGAPNTYYGAHPYPQPPDAASLSHKWEISTDFGGDFLSAEDVVYDRWYTQALVAWSNGQGKHTRFYWDLPDTTKVIANLSPASFGNTMPPTPALTWGDAPWAPSGEMVNGIIRGIQIYTTDLPVGQVIAESNAPLSIPAAASNIWYLNLNPTPTDISDKSGAAHHPEWVGAERPLLWTGT